MGPSLTLQVLTMFSEGTLDHRLHCLRTVLSLLSPLLILLHYHTAYVRLGTSPFPSSAGPGGGGGGVGGNWGGTEGVGSIVQQLQVDIAALPDPSDPHQVSEYLQTLCQLLYLQHTLTIKHYLQRTFLLHGNLTAIRTLRSVSIPTISHLTASSLSPSSPPSSLLPTLPPDHSNVSQTLLPWQHFLYHRGPTPSLLDHVVWETGNTVMAGLVALSSEDRVTANGELLGLSLVLEEVTNSSSSSSHGVSPDEQRAPEEMATPTSPLERAKLIKRISHHLSSAGNTEDTLDESISQSTTFLTEGGVSGGRAYEDSLSGEQMESLSESKLRRAQVARLLELLELGLIQDTLRHVSRFHHLVMLEWNRDISTLPLTSGR